MGERRVLGLSADTWSVLAAMWLAITGGALLGAAGGWIVAALAAGCVLVALVALWWATR